MNNLRFYEKARQVPGEAKKTIKGGRLNGFTDINPMWRIKRLTELFGPCGIGWWYEITDKRIVEDERTGQAAAFMDILLFYKDPESGEASHGIPGTGGSAFVAKEQKGAYMSDECFKMALTDAISVAAKALGIGADVYFEKDRSKYDKPEDADDQQGKQQSPDYTIPIPAQCESCHKEIVPYPDGNGKTVSVNKHCTGSLKKFGQILCVDCIKKIQDEGVME